jgi:hypothetical protein
MKNSIFCLLLVSTILVAQTEKEFFLTGNINFDSRLALEQSSKLINQDNYEEKKRTPILAAGMSLIIPGSGQFYNEDYWLTALFLAVEAAGITTAIIYNNKGDDQTVFFENYANENWAASKYASWSLENAARLTGYTQEEVDNQNFDIYNNDGSVNWSELNRLESFIGSEQSTGYSHHLAPFGDQQYYEMIGKYDQFNPGWAEFDYESDFRYGEPLTDQFLYYSDERAKANDYYSVAKTAVIIVIANHIVSALEAAWSSHRYNKSIQANISLKTENIGFSKVIYPQLNLKVAL